MKAVTEGKDYIRSFTDLAKVYGGGTGKGIKLATGSAEGKFSIKLSAAGKQKITRIVVNAKVYNVSDGGTLKIEGTTSGDASISSTTFTDYEFKGDTNFAWENLNFSVPKSKRIYLKSITVYYESDGPITEKSAKPEISGAASFTDNTEITITAASGASIYYTTDNTDPTTSSTQYSAPFTISETTTVKAIAVETGKEASEVATATFTKKMEGDYVLVTSLDDLDEASSYIIGVQAKNAAMSNEKVSGKLKQTSVTIAGDVLTPTDNVMTFHLVKNTSGNWAFKADNYAGGESYYIQNSTSTDCKMDSLAYYFPVTLDNNNNIIIKSSEGRWIHGYNKETTADFRNYSKKESNSSEVQLYRLGSKVLQKPVITLSEDKVYVGEKVTVTIDKKNAEKVYYTTDGTTPSATNGTEYAAPFEVTAEAEGTITVQAIGISGETASSVTAATITVNVKEPIPDGSWVLVEKASELEVGARYVIAYNGYAVSNAVIASNKLQSTPATVTGGKLGFTDDMMVFTLGNGSAEGKYTLKSNNYNNSTADSYLNFPKTNDADVAMASEPQELLINYTAGSSDVAIQLASGNRMLKGYNGTVFGYYSSTQSGYHNVQLYKEVDTRVACAAPTVTITPSEVIEGENATVSISGIESGATVRYTTDGTLPTATRGTVYAGEFTLSALVANTTVKAIAYADGKKNSEVAEATVNVVLKPRMPEVTWEIGETTYTAANDGSYEVPAGTVLNIKAVNGDKIKVTNLETEQSAVRESPNTLTVNSDIKVSFASVNSEKNLESEALSAIFTRKKVVPSTPVVTWTLDGVNHTAENDGKYNVYAGTQVTVTSENADKIVVTNSVSSDGEYNAPYTFTVTAAEMFTFAGKNADGTSSGITVMYTVVERPAENVYTLITDASQLKAGNKYVIAVKEQNMALSNQGNWNYGNNQYRNVVDGAQANAKFRIDENNVLHDQTFGTSSKEGIMVFTLGGSAGKWTLKADNYILSTAEPRPGELETGEWVKLYVLYVTDEPQPFFAMTTEPSENTISIAADGSATITNSNSTGYVMKYMGTRFGMSKVGNNGFPLVQLYGCVPQTKPEMPVVTYTKTIDGENVATEDCGEYTAINGSKITVTSKNATQIDINGTKYAAVNGTYSFTTDVDRLYIIKGVNEANEESAEYTLQIYVDYEAATIPEMHTLSQKQKDRTDKSKSLWAPVKFTGDVFIRGHYMKNDEGELSETLWVEDANANASAIYELGGEFQQPGHSIENGMMLKNFKVRSESYFNALEHNIMVLISWPEEVETDVQTYDFQNFLQQMEMAEEASANNVFKLQKFNGDITFAADGTATMTLKNGKTITVSNQLSFKGNGNKQSWSRTEGNGFNWLPGNEWLNGQTKQNTHLVGYVMPEGDGSNLSYVVYPAQITDDPGNITGVDGVENDNDGVSVVDGMIKAPAGSCIFSISGANVKANQTLTGGVYVVVTPNGKVVKVLVK